MRLRRLTISGFKTFASRAEVSFERGITAIVGPNGSGKSNLVDALRWALGETNARELRGQRMDEVIYAGGGKRPRLSVSEVELLIDNDEGRLPLPDPEVQIRRRVVRGATDTEYRLNGERVRLRDLDRLLSGTGLTQNGYAVVAQNDIDGIIEATPVQRRALVEQAAGVRSLRAACEEASTRIGHAEHVLQRLQDLLAEGEPRLTELALQAQAAIAQRELSQRLRELRGSLAREEWRAARGRLKSARRRLEHASSRWEAATEADTAFAERATAARSRLTALRDAHEEAREQLEAARVAAERALADARQWRERLRAAVARRRLARQQLRQATEDEQAAVSAVPFAVARDETSALQELRGHVAAREREEATARQALAEAEQSLADAEAQLAAAVAAQRQADEALRKNTLQQEVLASALAMAKGDIASAETGFERASADLEAAAAEAERLAETARRTEDDLQRAQQAVEMSWSDLNRAEEIAVKASEAARTALAQLAEARGRRRGVFGGIGTVGRAIEEGRLSGRRLADVISVPDERDAAAVAGALEHLLDAWVLDGDREPTALLDSTGPREGLVVTSPRAPLGDRPALQRLGLRPLLDAVEVHTGHADAVAQLLGDIWLAGDVGEAREAIRAGARAAVLPDGTAIQDGSIRFGRPAPALESTVAERDAVVRAEQATAAEAAAIAAVNAAREAVSRADTEATDAAATAQRARADAIAAETGVETRRREVAVVRERLAAKQSEHSTRLHEAASLEASVRALQETHERAIERVRASEPAIARAREHVERCRERVEETASALRTAQLDLARAEGATTEAVHRESEVRRALGSARTRRETAASQRTAAEQEAWAALAAMKAARESVETARERVALLRARLEETAPALHELERGLLALEREHAEVAVALARADDEKAAAALEVEHAEAEVSRLAEAAREEGDDDGGDWDPDAAERAEREIVRLERRVASLGPVNALAPEQYDALKARLDALRAHEQDLGRASADVRSMTRKLAADLERRFDTVFDAVSLQFQALFSELFPGGRASLRLEEPPVVEAAEEEAEQVAERRPGVEIVAQPPGKRSGPLRLLSGGERALTALAVVLALQQVNPSPFYVFDEVDAALDDSNVLRFTRLLRRLAAEQQFIVVTHNHITMAAADCLWGITIDGDGVSSVLGLRFDNDARVEITGTPRLQSMASRVNR